MLPRGADLHLGADAATARDGAGPALTTTRLYEIRAPHRRFALVALVCGVVFAAGCGDSEDSGDTGSSVLGSPDVQTTARETDCMDWNEASVEDQRAIVDSIAEFEGGAPTGTQGRTLPDDQAFDLFDRACEQSYASAFKLYKLYVRAAAFQSAQP
jgi:hypothetical protein